MLCLGFEIKWHCWDGARDREHAAATLRTAELTETRSLAPLPLCRRRAFLAGFLVAPLQWAGGGGVTIARNPAAGCRGGGHGARTGLMVVWPRRVQIFDFGLSKALAVSGNGLVIPMVGEAGSLRSEVAREGGGGELHDCDWSTLLYYLIHDCGWSTLLGGGARPRSCH